MSERADLTEVESIALDYVLGSGQLGASSSVIAARTGLPLRDVRVALRRLNRAGAITKDDWGQYHAADARMRYRYNVVVPPAPPAAV